MTMDAKPEISYDDFAKLDLRVATVTAAREHPNADKLLLLDLRVGEPGTKETEKQEETEKQIVAGIRGQYELESLVGRQIIIINNLQRAVIRGEESNGMLLAASDGDAVVLLRPDREVPAGAGIR
jgi:tRNA-binding protein